MNKLIVLAVSLVLAVGGCGDKNQPKSPPSAKPPAPSGKAPPKAPSNIPSYKSTSAAPGANAPPRDALYTIYCARVEGPMHVERANRMKDELIQSTSMKDWYAVHEEGQSLLYYGYYRAINDPKDAKETERARLDRLKIDQMSDTMGNRPFRQALFVELDSPDPVAPPEWNLVNAPGDCTLRIGVYMGSPQRKEAAVEAVRAARAQGIEAYYYHGTSSSSVCIGHWPNSAYQLVGGEAKARTPDLSEKVMIAPMTNDPVYNQQLAELEKRGDVHVVQKRVEILDPSLKAAMLQYPHNTVNGMLTKRMVAGKEVYDPAQLVPIPRDKTASSAQPAPAASNQPGGYDPNYRPAIPRLAPTPTESGNSGGRLRSIGD